MGNALWNIKLATSGAKAVLSLMAASVQADESVRFCPSRGVKPLLTAELIHTSVLDPLLFRYSENRILNYSDRKDKKNLASELGLL